VVAFGRQAQQAFLEGHVEAFHFFGGVFPLLRYDNLRAVVKQGLGGRRREESHRFVARRSHYLFESQFTLAGQGGRPREGRRRVRGGALPPPPPGAGARGWLAVRAPA
jgi:hypothetical protein